MDILGNLVLRLNYKQDLDLGSLNARSLVLCILYLYAYHAGSYLTREKRKGPEAHKKKAISVTSSCWKTISL